MAISVSYKAARAMSGPEKRLAEAVHARLWKHEPFRAARARLEIAAEGRRIMLSGRVRTQAMRYLAAYLALAVDGVEQVENRLVSDVEIGQNVANALAQDGLTRSHVIRVRSLYGKITLEGVVPSVEVEYRALQVAGQVPDVVAAESALELAAQ